VVGIAASGPQARALAAAARPDVVLLDLGLRGGRALALGEQLLSAAPGAKVVAITPLQDPAIVSDAMRVGLHGLVTQQTPLADLLSGVQAVLGGEVVLPHRLAPDGVRSGHDPTAALLASQLTNRERHILALLAEGRSGQEIARRLSISPNTVRTHVQSILTKLQVHSRLEAVAFAVRHEIVESPRSLGRAAVG
jgi:two-component system nitrate/nitrite response regulator NarL